MVRVGSQSTLASIVTKNSGVVSLKLLRSKIESTYDMKPIFEVSGWIVWPYEWHRHGRTRRGLNLGWKSSYLRSRSVARCSIAKGPACRLTLGYIGPLRGSYDKILTTTSRRLYWVLQEHDRDLIMTCACRLEDMRCRLWPKSSRP